jgi:hypothetical protein
LECAGFPRRGVDARAELREAFLPLGEPLRVRPHVRDRVDVLLAQAPHRGTARVTRRPRDEREATRAHFA